MSTVFQGSFTGGELAPSLWGRVDIATFQASLKKCRNFIVQPYGGLKNRPGTEFVASAKYSDKKTRLIPFSYSTTDSAVLEFGDLYFRIHINGAPLLYPAGHPSEGTPVEVATTYTEDEVGDLDFRQIADVVFVAHGAHKLMRVERLSPYEWRIVEAPYKLGPWGPLNVDTSKRIAASDSAAIGADITVSAYEPMFSEDNVGQLLRLESQDFAEPWEPSKAITAGDLRRCDGKTYEALTTGITGTLRPVQFSDNWHDGGVNWKYVHSGFGVVELKSPVTDGGHTMAATVKSTIPVDVVTAYVPPTGGTKFDVVGVEWFETYTQFEIDAHDYGAAGTEVDVYVNLDCTFYMPELDRYHILHVRRTLTATVVDATHIKFVGEPSFVPAGAEAYDGTVNSTEGYPALVGGTYVWQLGAWSDRLGWPKTVTFYQQRLVLGGSDTYPTTVWFSRSDSFDDFSENNPIQSDDSITYAIASAERNQIEALVSLKKLMAITRGGVWVFNSGQEDVIAPNNIAASLECYEGGSKLRVLGIGRSAIYLQDKGAIPRDLAYVFAEDGYAASDMSVYSNHLFKGKTIVDWAYQSHPFKIIWVIFSDGSLAGCTYMREHNVIGWHRHDSATSNGSPALFKSLVCVSEGSRHSVYFVVDRLLDTGDMTFAKTIERLSDRDAAECFLDCSAVLTYPDKAPHLANQNARVLLNSGDEADVLVGPDGTVPGITSGTFRIGYQITSDFELLTVNSDERGLTRNVQKLITGVSVLVEEARQLFAGASYTALFPLDAQSADAYDGTTISGVCTTGIGGSWGREAPLVFRHTKASPVSILAVIPEVSIGS